MSDIPNNTYFRPNIPHKSILFTNLVLFHLIKEKYYFLRGIFTLFDIKKYTIIVQQQQINFSTLADLRNK